MKATKPAKPFSACVLQARLAAREKRWLKIVYRHEGNPRCFSIVVPENAYEKVMEQLDVSIIAIARFVPGLKLVS